jgi:ATP-binding cassette, subfamily B, bacterial AbcA/BmrA
MNKKTISRYFGIFKSIKLPWLLILGCFVFSALTMKAELQSATLTADIVDASQSAIDGKVLMNYILVIALSAACNIFSNYFTYKMEETINMRVRVSLWTKIMHLPTKYYDEDNGDQLVSRVTSDAEAPSTLFSMAVSFVVCVVTTVQAFIQLFSYHKTLAMISLLIIPITLLFCIAYGKIMFRIGVYGTVTTAGSMAYLAERVRNFRLIKSALAEKLESEKGDYTFKQMYKADFLSWLMVAGYQLISGLFSIAFIVVTFVIGGRFMASGAVTIGDLTGFYMISGVVTLQLMQFFMNVGSVSGTFGTMQKISRIMSAESEPEEGEDVPEAQADLVFDNVTFGYAPEQMVLNGLSMRIPAGKVTAVIGGNGAGKSTLFKLMARLYEPAGGTICMDEENIRAFRLADWRDKFAFVFQSTPLIGGTVRENMTYGLERQVSEEELIAAAKAANCYDCIMAKPNGFDEDVGMNGSNFSGGQGQCISIARAMLRQADYLLLDEATSNLDVVSQAQVSEALERLMEGKTTVMIAHNYAATRSADYVVVMKDGAVEAAGTPEELLESNEYYQMFCKTL